MFYISVLAIFSLFLVEISFGSLVRFVRIYKINCFVYKYYADTGIITFLFAWTIVRCLYAICTTWKYSSCKYCVVFGINKKCEAISVHQGPFMSLLLVRWLPFILSFSHSRFGYIVEEVAQNQDDLHFTNSIGYVAFAKSLKWIFILFTQSGMIACKHPDKMYSINVKTEKKRNENSKNANIFFTKYTLKLSNFWYFNFTLFELNV